MAGSAKRERQLAREHYQRQQQRRAEMAARRRRVQQIAAVVVAVVLVVGGVAVLAATLGGGSDKAATAGATSSATPSASLSPSTSLSPSASSSASATTAASGCTYAKSASAASKNVGLPTYEKSKAATYRQPFGATIKTNLGDVVIALDAAKAPCTANSFKHLAQTKFYDKSDCHRLTTSGIFVLQCGDPTGSGSGGPGYQFGVENAPKDGKYPAGTLAMARTSDPNSNGSQFFIVYKETSLPDPTGYTVFGRVTKGLDIVTQVAAAGANPTGDGKPKKKITIESVTVGKA